MPGPKNGWHQRHDQVVHQLRVERFSNKRATVEVDILVAELGRTTDTDTLFRIRFDGTLQDAGPIAVLGASEDVIAEAITSEHRTDLSLGEALKIATDAIATVMDREIPPTAWEAGLLDRGAQRRAFVRLTPDEIAAALV